MPTQFSEKNIKAMPIIWTSLRTSLLSMIAYRIAISTLIIGSLFLYNTVHAAPVINNNSGAWVDIYENANGIFELSNMDVTAGTVQMVIPGTAYFITTEIKPRSFDAWQKLKADATIPTGAAITVDLLDADNGNAPIAGWTGLTMIDGEIDLSALPTNYKSIRVRFDLTAAGVLKPFVNTLEVTWHPVSLLLMDVSAPAEIQAGETIVYKIRYSVSYVEVSNLVIWNTLSNEDGGATNGVTYPADGLYADADQEDAPVFVSADFGGQYCAIGTGGCAVGTSAINVPENSVYWALGDVAEGTTATLNLKVRSKNGAIDGTSYANQVSAAGINLSTNSQTSSNVVTTELRSAPAPFVEKSAAGSTVAEVATDRYYAPPNSTVRFVIADPVGAVDGNDYAATGRERMYNTVIYDDLSDILGAANVDTTQGENGVFNISNNGFFDPAYIAPDGSGPFPAVVWEDVNNGEVEQGILEPGTNFYLTFEVTLLDPAEELTFENRVCTDSDQTEPICDTIIIETEIDYAVKGIYALGDELDSDRQINFDVNDDQENFVTYGDTIRYLHRVNNTLAVNVNNTVIFDMIPPNTVFSSAHLPTVANGRVFYSTDTTYTHPAIAPPVITTTMPTTAGTINQPVSTDLGPGWFDLATNPPANPADVTWVAYYIPQISAYSFDYNNPISFLHYAELNVKTDVPSFPQICTGRQINNYGLFTAYGSSLPEDDVRSPDDDERYEIDPDHEITVVKPEIAEFELNGSDVSLSLPSSNDLPNDAVYKLRITNDNTPTSDMARNVRVLLKLGKLPVNGIGVIPQYTSVTVNGGPGNVTSWDAATGELEIFIGNMPKGTTKLIELRALIPRGVMDGSEWSVIATVTPEDDLCTAQPESILVAEPLVTQAELNVFKNNEVVSLIAPGDEIRYSLTFFNSGTSPSLGTYVIDHVPDKTVFDYATAPNGEIVYISNALPPDLPAAMDPLNPLNKADFLPGGTFAPADPHPTIPNAWVCPVNWTVAECESTTWVGWLVDSPGIGLFSAGEARTIGLVVHNDEIAGNNQIDGSPATTQLFNDSAIFANGLLPAVGNEVVTTILEAPGLTLSKRGPASKIVAAGDVFDWIIGYHNDSASPDNIVILTDTLQSELTFLDAKHTWNEAAINNGATADNNGMEVPSNLAVRPGGLNEIQFRIAPDYRDGNLFGGEGGVITMTVQVKPGVPSGTELTNYVCGIAQNELAGDLNVIVPPCANSTVLVQNPDLATIKTVSPPEPASGDTVRYEIRVFNQGTNVAKDVVISDTLPSGVTFQNMVSVLLPPGSGYSGLTLNGPTVDGQVLTWSLEGGPMPGNSTNPEAISIIFEVAIDADVPLGTTLTNNACAGTSSMDEDPSNNCDETPVRIPYPDPTLSKDVDDAVVLPGGTVNWTIDYGNNNNADAAGVYIIDSLPNVRFVR